MSCPNTPTTRKPHRKKSRQVSPAAILHRYFRSGPRNQTRRACSTRLRSTHALSDAGFHGGPVLFHAERQPEGNAALARACRTVPVADQILDRMGACLSGLLRRSSAVPRWRGFSSAIAKHSHRRSASVRALFSDSSARPFSVPATGQLIVARGTASRSGVCDILDRDTALFGKGAHVDVHSCATRPAGPL